MTRLIALDMDGTLLDSSGKITERTARALINAQACGIRIVIATGRMYPSAMLHLKNIGLTSASIFYNGAVIREPSGKTIFEFPVSRELTSEIIELFRKRKWYLQLYSDDRLIVEDDGDERCKKYEAMCGLKAVALHDDFIKFNKSSSKVLGIAKDNNEFSEMQRKLAQRFTDRLYMATSWGNYVEMVDISVNKARALERLCSYYNIDRKNVMTVGDGNNDREMIEWAGIGVAMGNSREQLKQAADITAPSNDEDGAAVIIERAIIEYNK